MREKQRILTDFKPWIQDSLEAARNIIWRNVRGYGSSTDTDGRPFVPLASSTLARKSREGLDMRPLVATGAMTDWDRFNIRSGKRSGRLTHLVPRGHATRYPRMSRTGRTTMRRYDYGLAHQHGHRNVKAGRRQPIRQWWLEPGTKKWNAWAALIAKRLKWYFKTGHVRVTGGELTGMDF